MVIKLLIFDLDGIFTKENCYASVLFQRLYGTPHKKFYSILKKNKFLERTKKQGSTFNLFYDFFKKYNVKITEEKFWNLWLTNFKVNQEIVDFALSLKKEGKKLGILSDTFFERAEYMRQNLRWIKEFDYVLFSCDFGFTKNNPKLFQILVDKSGIKPEEIFFIDDDEDNVEVAKILGIRGVKFTDLENLKIELTDVFEDYEILYNDKKHYKSYKKGWKRKYK